MDKSGIVLAHPRYDELQVGGTSWKDHIQEAKALHMTIMNMIVDISYLLEQDKPNPADIDKALAILLRATARLSEMGQHINEIEKIGIIVKRSRRKASGE